MKISKKLAQQIVQSLGDIINQDINYINNNGIIIASTDYTRINSFHRASLECIKKRAIFVIDYDDQYEGVKKGINLPVYFENEVVGVIGITGNVEEVEKYGTVIQKMTEILLKENWLKDNKTKKREINRNLIDAIINDKLDSFSFIPESLNNSLKYIVVSDLSVILKNKDIVETEYLTNKILEIFENNHNFENIFVTIIYQQLIIIHLESNIYNLENFLNTTKKIIKTKFENISLNFGISQRFYNLNSAKKYYNQALDALSWSINFGFTKEILYYENMDIGILLTAINKKNRLNFVNKILKNIDKQEIKFYDNLLNIYGKHNGSIKLISKELFMHKNSIQYRLNKLKELTGYDARIYNDYIILKLAFILNNVNT